MNENNVTVSHSYGILSNIPADFHSADLRNYFSQFIESKGFSCFHFKHRPETKQREKEKEKDDPSHEESTSSSGQTPDRSPKLGRHNEAASAGSSSAAEDVQAKSVPKTFCCVLKLQENKMLKFIKMYHKKPWIDKKGAIMSSRCFISRIRVAETDKSASSGGSGKLDQITFFPERNSRF